MYLFLPSYLMNSLPSYRIPNWTCFPIQTLKALLQSILPFRAIAERLDAIFISDSLYITGFFFNPLSLSSSFSLPQLLRSLSLVIQNTTVTYPGMGLLSFILLEIQWVLSVEKLIFFRCKEFSSMISFKIPSLPFFLVMLF